MDRKRVFVHSEDEEQAVRLVKLLDRHGVTAFWVTEEEGKKLVPNPPTPMPIQPFFLRA